MFKTILVPVDYDDLSVPAVNTAVDIARSTKATVHLLYVVPDQVLSYLGDLAADSKPFLDDMSDYLKRLASTDPDIVTDKLVVNGRAAEAIIDYAQEHHCDLIVMATHARRGVERLLLGSVTEEVMRHATCPVLVVQPAAQPAAC